MSYCSPTSSSLLSYLDENKFFTTLTSITFAIIAIFWYILKCYTFFEYQKIPRAAYPKAPWGNIKDVLFQKTTLYLFLWKHYNRFKRKGCKLGGFYVFLKPGIVLVDPKLISQVVNKTHLYINSNLYQHRKKTIIDYTSMFQEEFIDRFLSNVKNIQGVLTDNFMESTSLAIHEFLENSTCLAFGLEKAAVSNFTNTMELKKNASTFRYYFNLVHPYFSKGESYTDESAKLVEDILKFRKKNDVRELDILQYASDLMNKETYLTPREIVDELLDIFIDNISQSYSSILLCLYELSINPDIQEELVGEIRRFNLKHKQLTFSSLKELVYLEAVVIETHRKYPPVPVVIKYCSEKSQGELGLDLPKGSLIFVPTFGIHHDPRNYLNPENFDVGRFLEDNVNRDIYFPYGFDSKQVIGFQFTNIHIKLVLFTIFSKFRVCLENKNFSIKFDTQVLKVHLEEPLPLKVQCL